MVSKRRNIFYENKKQETTEIAQEIVPEQRQWRGQEVSPMGDFFQPTLLAACNNVSIADAFNSFLNVQAKVGYTASGRDWNANKCDGRHEPCRIYSYSLFFAPLLKIVWVVLEMQDSGLELITVFTGVTTPIKNSKAPLKAAISRDRFESADSEREMTYRGTYSFSTLAD
ncbi:hypothetical protein AAG570_007235 [Ranatra chinensis]|uniref:Uncharacterized protein n=1 Tax=Ranatra chinensis TaxID=642074 RepID=A0ABD0YDT8_9HEMI